MAQRIAAVCALLVFSICVIGGIVAGNTFSTTVGRALLGMAAMFAVGLILGAMAQKMIEESSAAKKSAEKIKILEVKSEPRGR